MSKKLFIQASRGQWHQNAVIGGKCLAKAKYAYILGYYEAAENLVSIALERNKQDTLFFPICFNYRHYLELSLKDSIIATEKLYYVLQEFKQVRGNLTESLESKLSSTHSLEMLLNWLINHLSLVADEKFDEDIRKIIIEFHNMDNPQAQRFRYPLLKNGKIALPDQRLYDLENIRYKMEKVGNYLFGIGGWLDHSIGSAIEFFDELQQQQQQAEIEYEFKQEIPDYNDYFP